MYIEPNTRSCDIVIAKVTSTGLSIFHPSSLINSKMNSRSFLLNTFAIALLALFTSTVVEGKSNFNPKYYKNLCKDRHPIQDNDKRSHAIIKLAIEASSEISIISRDTPQHKATCWMIYDDPRKVDPRGNKAKYLERYALVTLYLNTKGPGWSRSDHWLTKESECDWYGVTCSRPLMGITRRISYLDLSFNKVEG